MQQMMSNPEDHERIMHQMMQDFETREHMMGHMMADAELMEQMGITTPDKPRSLDHNVAKQQSMMDSEMSGSMMSGMSFNANAPITMPMIDGYYKGEKVYFIHTEVSDNDMANMMSTMINFPTLHVSELTNIPDENLSKVYVFTNGISGTGPYGGGPFMFQIDVFDSVPRQMDYSQFKVPYLVTWNDNSTPRLLTSTEEIFQAMANDELTIQKSDLVVNAPMIVWNMHDQEQMASNIPNIFQSMPGLEALVQNVDIENYIVTFNLQSNDMDMMNP